ncbi:MAG: hypothetical protein AMJ88_11650 [Anaerolineae bacterium SM23_ 63]|nr:MAG: hypothetical protein AMJ88_11650 [Anaerolineae bacterium SM23_ 63]HEY46663.1 hypothetical protein [Anaerolineae bacterium]
MSATSPHIQSTVPRFGIGTASQWLTDRLRIHLQRGSIFGFIIIGALVAFEIFNYSTTEFALNDLLGDLQFSGLRWSTILALAFCSMDFAGIARLFTPEKGRKDSVTVWYLLGAWFLAATMNAMLTWWAVSLALLGHNGLGNELLGRESLVSGVPIFVAVLVWLIRVLIIGTFTMTGERLFPQRASRSLLRFQQPQNSTPHMRPSIPRRSTDSTRSIRPAPKPAPRPDHTYSPQPMQAKPRARP